MYIFVYVYICIYTYVPICIISIHSSSLSCNIKALNASLGASAIQKLSTKSGVPWSFGFQPLKPGDFLIPGR